MKKQFRRAGALMLALLMLMTAAPALAEDVPSAADGTQIEEIIGEEPAVTEAPTAIPTEAPPNTAIPTVAFLFSIIDFSCWASGSWL